MLDLLFNLPLAVSAPAIILALCLFATVGLLCVRRHVLPRLRVQVEDSEFIGSMVQSVLVFYGLAVALIAVSVWQNYSDASKLVSQDAANLASFYRDVSLYPEPMRSQLQLEVREYVLYVIHDAWPIQQQGKVPPMPGEVVGRLMQSFASFEPATEGQKLKHGEALRSLNNVIQATRLRLEAVESGLPTILWAVIFLGAAISLTTSFFFKVDDARLHGILVNLLAVFMGLVIFLILALDRPFSGELGLSSHPYQILADQVIGD